jgi:hypothetical protein
VNDTLTPVTDYKENEHGVEHKHLYSTPSGKKWLGKVEDVDAELDHYIIMKHAGLRTPDIGMRQANTSSCRDCEYVSDGEREILIEWLDTHQVYADVLGYPFNKDGYTQLLKMWMIDFTIGHWDRHSYNFLVSGNEVVPIDGGKCFRVGEVLDNLAYWTTENPVSDLFMDTLTDVFSFVDVMLCANEVVRAIRSALSELTPEHQTYVQPRLNKLTTITAEWYRSASRALVLHSL